MIHRWSVFGIELSRVLDVIRVRDRTFTSVRRGVDSGFRWIHRCVYDDYNNAN
jgi:hypothetical protein